jgi:hypothetical protein
VCPFRRKAVRPSRAVPSLPFVGGDQWAQLGTAASLSPQAAER